jgi:hypothetical protein
MGRTSSEYLYILPNGLLLKLIKKYNPELKLDVTRNDYCSCEREYTVVLEFNIDEEDAQEIMSYPTTT